MRNSKQIRMTKIENGKLYTFKKFENLNLEFVSDFDIRVSNFVILFCGSSFPDKEA